MLLSLLEAFADRFNGTLLNRDFPSRFHALQKKAAKQVAVEETQIWIESNAVAVTLKEIMLQNSYSQDDHFF